MAEVFTEQAIEEARKAREVEYGTYTANEQIYVDGGLGYNPGDPVPVSVVKRLGLQAVVSKVDKGDSK